MGDDAISANTSGDDAVAELDAGKRKLAVQTIVRAQPAQIFGLISDPVRHAELDGSRTVGRVVTGSGPLHLGDQFTIAMKQYHFPYLVTNVVTAWESDRLLEWGRRRRAHRWRWELVEVAPGQTQVTETFDYSNSRLARIFELTRVPQRNIRSMKRTLVMLAKRFS